MVVRALRNVCFLIDRDAINHEGFSFIARVFDFFQKFLFVDLARFKLSKGMLNICLLYTSPSPRD